MMKAEELMIMAAVAAGVYVAGYTTIAIGIFALLTLSSLMGAGKTVTAKKAVPGGIKISGAQMLEPIVIETTRGAPFRIPADMRIRIKPGWSARSWREKAAVGIGRVARMGMRPFYGPGYADDYDVHSPYMPDTYLGNLGT